MVEALLLAACAALAVWLLLSAAMAWGARRAAVLATLEAPEAFRSAPRAASSPGGEADEVHLVFLGDVQRGITDVVRPLAARLPAAGVHLLVSSGDLISHGEGPYYGIAAAAFARAGWTTPTRVVPGNHDLYPRRSKDDRIGGAEFTRVFGARHWALRVGPLLVVGVDDGADWLLEDQIPWLRGILTEHPGVPWILVCHRPLYSFDLDHRRPRAEIAALLALLAEHRPELVVSGHLHQAHDETVEGIRHIVNPHGGDVHGLGIRRGDFQVLHVRSTPAGLTTELESLPRRRDLAAAMDQLAVRFWADRRKLWGAVLAWPGRFVLRLLGRDVPVIHHPVERRVPDRETLKARRRNPKAAT